ncbi:MAG: hypothetical protein JXD23_10960 [Spirochaetales bacterium]|nr:hypothetical protein [Spirochaetales bacterium]
MEYRITGKKGEAANVAISVAPQESCCIIKGRAPNAAAYTQDSGQVTELGKVPLTEHFHIVFYNRPWKFQMQIGIGGQFAHSIADSSENQGLPSTTILTPDTANITVIFEGV